MSESGHGVSGSFSSFPDRFMSTSVSSSFNQSQIPALYSSANLYESGEMEDEADDQL